MGICVLFPTPANTVLQTFLKKFLCEQMFFSFLGFTPGSEVAMGQKVTADFEELPDFFLKVITPFQAHPVL